MISLNNQLKKSTEINEACERKDWVNETLQKVKVLMAWPSSIPRTYVVEGVSQLPKPTIQSPHSRQDTCLSWHTHTHTHTHNKHAHMNTQIKENKIF